MSVMKRLLGRKANAASASTTNRSIQPYRSPNKKGHTGARAGLGHSGRAPTVSGHPRGPGFPPSFPSVRLPNRGTATPKRASFFGRVASFFRGK